MNWRPRQAACSAVSTGGAAHSAARIGKGILARQAGQPDAIREIAWKAQGRLCGRYRRLTASGIAAPKAIVAVARELAGFVWAIARQVQPAAAK